jgi:NADPH:quinone reductase-like Zn-dependent oxidoreductase
MLSQSIKEDLDAIAKLIDESRIKPVIHKVFPLEQAAEAEWLGQEGHVQGKIVLQIRKE